jgi:release factor glutamine methyltransferase
VGEVLAAATDRLTAAGSETPRLDAELLLGTVLGVDRTALMAHPEATLGSGQLDRFEAFLVRREGAEPVAYIRGFKEFYGAAIAVDARVLIPRPETETLVGLALARVRAALTSSPRTAEAGPFCIWDVGTGSAAIPVAIALELRRRRYGDAVHFFVSDVSAGAREVALVNVVSHGLAHLFTFAQGDLTDVSPRPSGPVELLLANLPYIPSATLATLPATVGFEPPEALDGGPDGLALIRRLVKALPEVLARDAVALLEIGSDQAGAIVALAASELPDWSLTIHDDLGGRPRVAQLVRAHD